MGSNGLGCDRDEKGVEFEGRGFLLIRIGRLGVVLVLEKSRFLLGPCVGVVLAAEAAELCTLLCIEGLEDGVTAGLGVVEDRGGGESRKRRLGSGVA